MNYQQQQQYIKNVPIDQHQRILKKIETQELKHSFSPQINKVSQQIVHQINQQTSQVSPTPKFINLEKKIKEKDKKAKVHQDYEVFNRLSQIKKDQLTNQLLKEVENQDQNQDLIQYIKDKNEPKDNKKQPRIDFLSRPKSHHPNQDKKQKQPKQVTKLDQNAIIKFVKEFQTAHNNSTEDFQIQIFQMREILEEMCFLVQDQGLKNTKQEQLFFQAWRMVCSDKFQVVNSNDLLIFLFAIQNLNTSNLINSKTLQLTDDQVIDIHQYYNSFYYNYKSRKKIFYNTEEHPFAPEICEKSRKLAQNRKEKIIEQINEYKDVKVSQQTWFDHHQNIKENNIMVNRQIKYEKEMDECTFQPNINNSHFAQGKLRYDKQYEPNDRNTFIYIENMKIKESKTTDQIIYEKDIHEYTFQPNLYKTGTKYRQDEVQFESMKQVKDIQSARETQEVNQIYQGQQNIKTIWRYLQSTKRKENTDSIEKQQPVNFQISKCLQFQNQKPILVLDVNLGNDQSSQVHVYQGDKIDQIARQFGQKFNLDHTMTQRLELILNQQLQQISR